MDIKLIGMFNAALSNEKRLDFNYVNNEAMKRGYIVQPEACTYSVMDYLRTLDINPNATFYKEWNDVLSKSRFELFVDQILHYASTYGTDYQGTPYVPNTGAENVPALHFENYKVIVAISEEELFNRCLGLLQSGIALHNDTLESVCAYVIEMFKTKNMRFEVDSIKNREALIRICESCHIYPNDPESLVRYIVFSTTRDAMIIKNRDKIHSIYSSSTPFDFSLLEDKQLAALSKVFYRYRKILLAFRKVNNPKVANVNARIINEIRRRARHNHVPMKMPFWSVALTANYTDKEIKAHLGDLTNFKKIALIQAIRENLDPSASDLKIYTIRNGRVFTKQRENKYPNVEYQMHLLDMLKQSIIDSLKDKATYYRMPEGLDIPCPVSEKTFIGNYPIGTNFQMSNHNFVGIYWKSEWGTQDFDLKSIDISGTQIGWNAYYRGIGDSIVYSGDMTRANPEAAEVMYTKGSFGPRIFKVNRYNGTENSKFKVFLGIENDLSKPVMKWVSDYNGRGMSGKVGYMVDPNSIKFMNDYVSIDRETTIGVVNDNKFYVTDLRSGNKRVSDGNTQLLNATISKFRYLVSLREILDAAGFLDYEQNRYHQTVDENGNVTTVEIEWKDGEYIDFGQLSKDTLINLFA